MEIYSLDCKTLNVSDFFVILVHSLLFVLVWIVFIILFLTVLSVSPFKSITNLQRSDGKNRPVSPVEIVQAATLQDIANKN